MAGAPKKGRLTLYEDLLSKETIAELQAKDAAKQVEEEKRKKDATKPMFVPTNLGKKPSQQKARPKPNFSSMHKLSSSASTVSMPPQPVQSSPDKQPSSSAAHPTLIQKRGFNDWLADEDEEDFYYGRPRERGGRKKKNKKQDEKKSQTCKWDDIYDPTVPAPFQHYRRSDVEYDINDEWKRRLYQANKSELRRQGKDVKRASSDEDAHRPTLSASRQVAPSGSMSFVPLSDIDDSRQPSSEPCPARSSPGRRSALGRGYDEQPCTSLAPPPPPAVDIELDETADDAHVRRMAMGGVGTSNSPEPLSAPRDSAPTFAPAAPSPPVVSTAQKQTSAVDEDKKAKIVAQIAAMKAKIEKSATPPTAPPVQVPPTLPGLSTPQHSAQEALQNPALSAHDAAQLQAGLRRARNTTPAPPPPCVISAPPVYNPEYLERKAQADDLASIPDAPDDAEAEARSSRPGQSGFAERLMKKLGWERGQGLGASGEGITTAIIAKAEKRKKKSDAEGAGFVAPANMGKIVGGKRGKPKIGTKHSEDGTPQPDSLPDKMTEVVKLEGMLENMDVDQEIAENNLLQEIGDEMGDQYGKVERLFIWRKHAGGNDDVFVKFTSPLSAVRCMKGMDGTEFAGNQVVAKFWDAEKFENGEYA